MKLVNVEFQRTCCLRDTHSCSCISLPRTHPLRSVCRQLSQQTPINSKSAEGCCLCHLISSANPAIRQQRSHLCFAKTKGFSPTEKPVGCKSATSQLLISSIRHAAGKQICLRIIASETERLAARCVQQQGSHNFKISVLIKCLFFVSKLWPICSKFHSTRM